MIRGNLKLLVLKALDKKPLSGYALMKFIEERIGTRPSPGSIYPVLDDLAVQKFVACEEEGRKKVYSITKEGKERLKIINLQKDNLLQKVEESMKMWSALTGEKISHFQGTIDALKKGKYSIEDIPPEVADVKMEMARIFSRGLFQKNRKKVREILNKASRELREII